MTGTSNVPVMISLTAASTSSTRTAPVHGAVLAVRAVQRLSEHSAVLRVDVTSLGTGDQGLVRALPRGRIDQGLGAVDGLPVLPARPLDPGVAVAVVDDLAVALLYVIRGNDLLLAAVPLVDRVLDQPRDRARPPDPGRGPDVLGVQPLRDLVQRPAFDAVPVDQRNVDAPLVGGNQVPV